ncbi:fibronectin-binding SSURE repeat-containing protein [Chloroflexi bacterium TSY]|nr:fibronectin-binding SSURE repeat-containing protein [Chloroflexi bacterium TSY]
MGDVVQPQQGVVQQSPTFPIPRRALTDEEASVVAQLRANGMSWKKLSFTVYGHKDGKTDDWIKEAVHRGQANGHLRILAESQQVQALSDAESTDWIDRVSTLGGGDFTNGTA